MIKTLADRLAEAFAEYMHDRIRQDLWGYQNADDISKEDMIKEKYILMKQMQMLKKIQL